MARRLERRNTDRAQIHDRDTGRIEIMEKTVERWVDDDDDSVEEIVTTTANISDGEIFTKVSQFGPVCSAGHWPWRCNTRLGAQHLTCFLDDQPICKRHAVKYRGHHYHRGWCVASARIRHFIHWLFSPVGSKEDQ